jgi:hypothetical protein
MLGLITRPSLSGIQVVIGSGVVGTGFNVGASSRCVDMRCKYLRRVQYVTLRPAQGRNHAVTESTSCNRVRRAWSATAPPWCSFHSTRQLACLRFSITNHAPPYPGFRTHSPALHMYDHYCSLSLAATAKTGAPRCATETRKTCGRVLYLHPPHWTTATGISV